MKKRVLSILLALSMVVGGLSSLAFVSAATGETFHVTVNAADGGKVSTDGTNWSDSVVVPVASGETLGDSVQYKPDEGYKINSVTTTTVIKKVVAAATCTAAIDDAGNLYTAGDNSRGQLARKLGSYVYEDAVLTKVSTSAKIIDVALGTNHIVVLDENGDVWTAGCNQYGALGIDENAGRYWYGTEIDTLKKVTVGDGSVKIKAVAAGQYHTILIDENGGVWTAGLNSDGELGRSDNVGSGTANAVFKKADGLENVKIVSAAGGTAHTILLDEDGNVWTAGTSNYGLLGRQTADATKVTANPTFEKVTDGISGVKITAIAAGSYHNVLLAEDGSVWTVGSNLYGQLGREITGSVNSEFKQADLQGATAAKFIAAYGSATVVIDTDGNARTCGINSGHLGRTVTGPENPELLVAANGIDNTKMMAAAMGTYHTILLDENGGLWTCGKNQAGQLCRTEGFKGYTSVRTFGAVTDGLTQTITFDEMKNTVITSGRAFTITSAVRGKVQLEYILNGGNWVDGFTPRNFAYKDEGLSLPDDTKIERPGYTFTGWETSDSTADPIKCSATWTAKTYTVTFNANGGTVTPDTMTVTYGEPFAKMPIPVRMGYVFGGWYDDMNGGNRYGDKDGNSASNYDKTENCTLYAMWEEVWCTVTRDANGGTLTGAATSRERQNGPIDEPDAPTREGYSFSGWYKDAACTQPWNFRDWVTGDMTLYAGWTINQYTITIKPENGGQDMTITEDYGTTITAPALKRTGYIFAGWDKEFPATMPAGDLTITAKWTKCNHAGSTAQPTCTDSAVCTLCGDTIAKLGHDFSVRQKDADEHWYKCSRCDATDDRDAHNWDNGTITTPATCTTAGERVYACSKCDAKKTEIIGAKGHDLIFHAGQAATCAESGWEDYYTCSRGDYTTYKEIPATGNHTYEWQSENGYYWQKCKVCSGEKEKKLIPELVITGADKVCRTQDYTFGFTLPDGCKLITAGYEFEKIGSDLEASLENGKYTVALSSSGYPAEETAFKVTVTVETEDGFAFRTEKTVTILNDHTGGKATCKDKAVCEICGKAYGELEADNHADLTHIDAKAATKDAEGNIEYWYCDGCGKYYSDAAATKEITKAETITAKLKEDSQKDPAKTGDSNSLVMWIALLFVSGSVMTGVTVISKKKKRSVR